VFRERDRLGRRAARPAPPFCVRQKGPLHGAVPAWAAGPRCVWRDAKHCVRDARAPQKLASFIPVLPKTAKNLETAEIIMEINNLRRSRNPEINDLRKAHVLGLAALAPPYVKEQPRERPLNTL
jgi:hypothetical protein